MRHRIYILLGKSASGKDTVYQELLRRTGLPLRRVVPYTTRPIRSGEEEGREYHFVSRTFFLEWERAGRILEFRRYDTCYGPWYYFTADDGQIDLSAASYLMIGTLESYGSMRDYYGADRVIPLYVEVDNAVRLQRARQREEQQAHPRFDELERRFTADEKDFSEEKLRQAGITRHFHNDDLHRCVEEIAQYVRSLMSTEQQ